MAGGYVGKILKVDLSTKKVSTEPIDEEVARKYIGGKGYAVYLLYQYLKEYEGQGISVKDIDPLGPKNVMIFATGPGTGVPRFPSPSRYHVMTLKAPLTGSIGSGNAGGEWGAFLKFAGFDGIVIEGASDTPVYLALVDGKAEIRDAGELWGKNTMDTTRALMNSVRGKNTSVACIGPAGENLVPMAVVMNDEYRAAGRAGLGAVMGSKKLKAIIVSGTKKLQWLNLRNSEVWQTDVWMP